MNTLGRMHRFAETNLRYPLSDYTVRQTTAAQHPLCALPVCACMSEETAHSLTCSLRHRQHQKLSHPCNPSLQNPPNWLPWRRMAFGRAGLVCFSLCFFISYKTSGRVQGMSDLMRRPFVLFCFYRL